MLKKRTGLDNDGLGDIFELWNRGELNSFLIEITSHILHYKEENGDYFWIIFWMWPGRRERENECDGGLG